MTDTNLANIHGSRSQKHIPVMEDELQKSPRPGYPADGPDAKYLSGLSTILVATIQEAKDRISQIEYIFCSQLFPNFHLKTQSIQKLYSEEREAAEDAYKEKEQDLLLQIKKLQCEKQQVMEEKADELNDWKQVHKNLQKVIDSKEFLILRHENTIKEVEEKNIIILKKQLFLEAETEKLQLELAKKSEEVDEVMKMLNRLLQINQSCAFVQKGIQLKEYEEKVNEFISELENKGWKFDELLSGLREKMQEVENGRKLQENLLKKIEYQASEIMNIEQLVNKHVKENSLLTSKIGSLVTCVDELKKELLKKNKDLEEEKKVQDQLFLQIDSFSLERAKRGTELEGFENERRLLLDKQKVLEETIDYLQQIISEKSTEHSTGMELHGKLLQQFEAKDSELLSEKRKHRDLITRYMKLKSQYNYVCEKLGLTPENMLSHDKIEDSEKLRHEQTPTTSRDIENKASKAVDAASEVTRPQEEQELLPHSKGTLLIERTNPASSSTTSALVSPKCPSGIQSYLPGGAKRPISYWRDTRSHQSRLGPDPHDDFLDTPLENVKENWGKVKEETHKCVKQDIKNKKFSNSDDDETQDMNVDPEPRRRQMSPSTRGTSGFKYVEPLRKKSDRESLKGMECKQCKKFYDAVLPNGEEIADGSLKNKRCEHHNEVSRHRYRYAPPSTPEGFWNIGFESEM